MSLWASPEGDKAHDAEVSEMIGSLEIKKWSAPTARHRAGMDTFSTP